LLKAARAQMRGISAVCASCASSPMQCAVCRRRQHDCLHTLCA
jgi:hypothetical protein